MVLRWQLIASAILALVAAIPLGTHGAISAALGGAVNLAAGGAYAAVVSWSRTDSAGETLRTVFRAEAAKVLVIIVLLWLALTQYRSIVPTAFFGSFVVTVAIFAAAVAVRDTGDNKTPRATGDRDG